ncbi:Uncharacterized protein FKW44_023373 [Caligus rogercresseyi]|uniref:Gelsolin-like domain-containing protein n=1 Tax=Caligus rogercresseyi TaxID=217165 RepID=A0A7T8JUP3_CALRO|nr:Uncharacterized protein FKW44_023373 [Caligus rogercresseyi]
MSHFKTGLIIRQAPDTRPRALTTSPARNSTTSAPTEPLCRRCIQIPTRRLTSQLMLLLHPQNSGVYVWIGSKSPSPEAKIAEEIACTTLWDPGSTLEPENFFWIGLKGKKPYDVGADFMEHARLFRCSNERDTSPRPCPGRHHDPGHGGSGLPMDGAKLSYKSAHVYIQHLRAKYPERLRKLFLTIMGKESRRFTRCFHGWGPLKSIPR